MRYVVLVLLLVLVQSASGQDRRLLMRAKAALKNAEKAAKQAEKLSPTPKVVKRPELKLPMKTGDRGTFDKLDVYVLSIEDKDHAILRLEQDETQVVQGRTYGGIRREEVWCKLPTKDLLTHKPLESDQIFTVVGVKKLGSQQILSLEQETDPKTTVTKGVQP